MASLISSTQMGSNSSLSGSPPQTCAPSSATSGTSTMSLTSDLQDVKPGKNGKFKLVSASVFSSYFLDFQTFFLDLLLLIGKDRECGDDVSHRSSSPTVQDSSKQTQFYCEVDMACPVEL